MSRDPSPVALDGQRQLFLDDHLVAHRSGLRRRVCPAERHRSNPLIWKTEPWEPELATLYGQTGALNWGFYSPDGTRIITTAADGTVRTFVVTTEELVELARSRLSRSLTTEECQKYLHVEECPERP